MANPDPRHQLLGSVLLPLLTEIDFGRLEEAHAAELRKLCVERVERDATPAQVRDLGGRRELARLGGDLGALLVACRGFFTLLQAEDVGEVLVNGPHRVSVERGGRREDVGTSFPSREALLQLTRWITSAAGRPVSEQTPVVDARLPDGSRISAVLPPVAVDGPVLSIRRSRHLSFELEGLAVAGTLPPSLALLLRAAVGARLNILVCGAAGTGRTTLLGALARCVDVNQRLATIEDLAELRLGRPHVLRLECSSGATPRQLVQSAVRMRTDRLVLGDIRGPEAWEFIQAISCGFGGSMAAIRAASPRDAMESLETFVSMAEPALGERVLRRQLGRTIDLVVQLRRLADGRRVVSSISEVAAKDPIGLQELFRFHDHGEGPDGRSVGTFAATGVRPALLERMSRRGYDLPSGIWKLQEAVA